MTVVLVSSGLPRKMSLDGMEIRSRCCPNWPLTPPDTPFCLCRCVFQCLLTNSRLNCMSSAFCRRDPGLSPHQPGEFFLFPCQTLLLLDSTEPFWFGLLSPFASGMFMIKDMGGSLRFCMLKMFVFYPPTWWLIWLCFFFFQYWGLNSGPMPWATPPALFLWRVFQDRVSRTICLGWLWTAILLISASWVARITVMSHQRLAW
jgi:hypothetical protein